MEETVRAVKAIYRCYPGDIIRDIELMRSTAAPGLAAKPILAIDLIVDVKYRLQQVISILEKLDYKYMGKNGIKDRYAEVAPQI